MADGQSHTLGKAKLADLATHTLTSHMTNPVLQDVALLSYKYFAFTSSKTEIQRLLGGSTD